MTSEERISRSQACLRRFRQLGQWDEGHAYITGLSRDVADNPMVAIEATQLYLVQGHCIRAWDISSNYAFRIFENQRLEGAISDNVHDEALVCLTLLSAYIGILRHGKLQTATLVAQRVYKTCLKGLDLPCYERNDVTNLAAEDSSDVPTNTGISSVGEILWANSLLSILNSSATALSDVNETMLLILFYLFKIWLVAGEQGLLDEQDVKHRVQKYVDKLRSWTLSQGRAREARYLTYLRIGLTKNIRDDIDCLNVLLQTLELDSDLKGEEALTHVDVVERMLNLGEDFENDHIQNHYLQAQKLFNDCCHAYGDPVLRDIQLNYLKKNLPTSEYVQRKIDLAETFLHRKCYILGIGCLIRAVPIEHDMGHVFDRTKHMIRKIQDVISDTGAVFLEQVLFINSVAQSLVRGPEHGYAREALENYVQRLPDEMSPKIVAQLYSSLTQAYTSLGNHEKAAFYAGYALEAAIQSESPEDASDAAFLYAITRMSQARHAKSSHLGSLLFATSRNVLQMWTEIDLLTNLYTGALEKLTWLAWVEMTIYVTLGVENASARSDKWIESAAMHSARYGITSDKLREVQHMQAIRLEKFDVATNIVQERLDALKSSPASTAFAIGQAATSVSLTLLQKYQNTMTKVARNEIAYHDEIFNDLANSTRLAGEAYDNYSKTGGTEMVVTSLNFIWLLLGKFPDDAKAGLVSYWLKEAEKVEDFCDSIRRSIPISANAQSLVDKRLALESKEYRKLYRNAVTACRESEDPPAAWSWIQKAKARSLCDVFGSRAFLPQKLLENVAANTKTKELYDRERQLMENAVNAGPIDYLEARRQIEACRVQMKEHSDLRKVLDVREGALNIEFDDTELATALNACGYREEAVKYVDWYLPFDAVSNTHVTISVRLLSGATTVRELNISYGTIVGWIRRTLDCPREASQPLRRPDALGKLRQLAPLVASLAELTDEGDLLILSPSGPLNRIPLHALSVNGQPLIARNPIIYSASAPIFRQCHVRALAQSSTDNLPSQSSFLSVFETPGDDGQRERDEIHRHAEHVANEIFKFELYEGEAVTKELFQNVAAQSQWLHYHGHAIFHNQDVFRSCLVLSKGLQELGFDEATTTTINTHASIRLPTNNSESTTEPNSCNLTLTDMFAADMQKSSPHVTIIACDSGSQEISIGDEPTGIIPALLFAGATSAIGTLWPVDSHVARIFSTRFYRSLQTQIQDHAEITSGSSAPCTSDKNVVVLLDLAKALRSAVCEMMKRENTATNAPDHWAPYVLHGSWFRAYSVGR